MILLPDQKGAVVHVLLFDGRFAVAGRDGRGAVEPRGRGRHRHRGAVAVVDPAAVRRLAQAGLQPAGGQVERGVRVGRARLGADDRPAGAAGELHPRALVGEARVVLLADFDVDAADLAVELDHLRELVQRMPAEALCDVGVPALYDDVPAGASLLATTLHAP